MVLWCLAAVAAFIFYSMVIYCVGERSGEKKQKKMRELVADPSKYAFKNILGSINSGWELYDEGETLVRLKKKCSYRDHNKVTGFFKERCTNEEDVPSLWLIEYRLKNPDSAV